MRPEVEIRTERDGGEPPLPLSPGLRDQTAPGCTWRQIQCSSLRDAAPLRCTPSLLCLIAGVVERGVILRSGRLDRRRSDGEGGFAGGREDRCRRGGERGFLRSNGRSGRGQILPSGALGLRVPGSYGLSLHQSSQLLAWLLKWGGSSKAPMIHPGNHGH